MYIEEINIHNIYKLIIIIRYKTLSFHGLSLEYYLIFVSLVGNLKTNGMHVIRKNI